MKGVPGFNIKANIYVESIYFTILLKVRDSIYVLSSQIERCY